MDVIKINSVDIIIIGSGLAALSLADRLSEHKNVIVLTKTKKNNSNSVRAQGGVAASISESDNWKSHYLDTMIAGCNYNNPAAVELLVKQGPEYLTKWIEQGLSFDRDHLGKLTLGKEGAHMHRRIIHAGGDATGKVIMDFLINRLRDKVKIVEDETVLDLIVEANCCQGVVTSNIYNDLSIYYANHVVLATGGCGGLYNVTSNDETVTGDGIALAYRAGAQLTDLEFIQFHPTMLYTHGKSHGLVSEAVRGEGAILVTEKGRPVMKGVHPLEDLAPRDIVARTIQAQINKGNRVYLDISMINNFKEKFPTITSICEQANVSINNKLLPVAPGAHFSMGGVVTDLTGITTVIGLYAIGEVACTGVHGANRLASNSLLEGIVYSNQLADHLLAIKENQITSIEYKNPVNQFEQLNETNLPTKQEITQMMTAHAGIERTQHGLTYARKWIEQFGVHHNHSQFDLRIVSKEDFGKINMLTTCWLIIMSALERTESRGAHYRKDYPLVVKKWDNKRIIRQKLEFINNQKIMFGVGK
nr:L-aspartate oxidase [Aquibacillus halophilus]